MRNSESVANPIRVAFLGGGTNSAVGRAHFSAIQLDGKFKLTAGCFSRSPQENLQSALTYGVTQEHCCHTLVELADLYKTAFDAIIILTPTSLHHEHVSYCLARGIPVICEKSLATSLAEVRSLKELEEQHDGYLCVTYNYTGYPMVRELQSLIKDAALGQIQQLNLEMPQEGFTRLSPSGEPAAPQEWRLNDSAIPTVSLDLGAHLQIFVEFLIGETASAVVATSDGYGNFNNIVDSVSCLARYPSGMTSSFWYTKAALGHRNGLRIRIFGSNGSAEWFQGDPEKLNLSNAFGDRSILDRGSSTATESNKPRYTRFKAGHPAGYIEAFANYYHDIALDLQEYMKTGIRTSPFVFGVNAEIKSMALFEAIQRSSNSKQWEAIDA